MKAQTQFDPASDKSQSRYYVKSTGLRICSPQLFALLDVVCKNRTRNLSEFYIRSLEGCWRLSRTLIRIMARTLAPLRRIVSRQLEVLSWDRIHTDKPQSFVIQDHLECGHVQACFSWDIFDLLNAYTDNPEVSAKRHRCHPCASLLLDRKPVQSVGLVKKAGVA